MLIRARRHGATLVAALTLAAAATPAPATRSRARGGGAAAGDGDVLSVRRRRPPAASRRTCRGRLRRGGVLRQRHGQRLRLAGAGPGASSARRTRRTPRGSSSAGRRSAPSSAATSWSRCSTRRTCSTSTSAGRCRTTQFIRNGDAWVGRHRQAGVGGDAEDLRPGAVRAAVVRQPAAARRPAQLRRRSAADSSRDHRERPGWDIYTQVGAWLRERRATQPAHLRRRRPASPVEHVYGFGYSQTGGYLVRLHQRHPPAGRAPTTAGPCTTATSSPWPAARSPAPTRSTSARRAPGQATRAASSERRRADHPRSCPSRTTCAASPRAGRTATRRPTEYRHYEMAGAGHATPDELYFSAAPDDIVEGRPCRAAAGLQRGPAEPVPEPHLLRRRAAEPRPVGRATGVAPPRASPIRSRTAQPVLDEFGNVVGRPALAVRRRADQHLVRHCDRAVVLLIAGYEIPFDQALLDELYPTHGAYVRRCAGTSASWSRTGIITRDRRLRN